MKRAIKIIAAAAPLWMTSVVVAPDISAAELSLPSEGWVSWQVRAVADAPAWCCFSWDDKAAANPSCQLDDRENGYRSRDDETTDSVRIYARFGNGTLQRLRALAPSCPVQVNGEIRNLTDVSADASARWLGGLLDR